VLFFYIMKTKAVFLDRDGVINDPDGNYYVFKKSDFKINIHIFDRLKEYQKQGYLMIIISNQGGISKGLYTKEQVEELHKYMHNIFRQNNINITETYFCPHHSQNEKCICRKPDSLLIEKAIARFNIDKSLSFFIGDSKTDAQAAEKAGIKAFIINKNGFLPQLPL